MNSISENDLFPPATLNRLDVEVSYYTHKADKAPIRKNLTDLLRDTSRVNEIDRVRAVLKEKGQTAYKMQKANQPAFLISVQCENGHSEECIINYTGLLSFDLDSNDNPGWTADEMKACLGRCKNVAYCGLSLSGSGVFGIIPIAFPHKHVEHFNALKRVFKAIGQRYKGIPLITDKSCGNPNRLRFCSYDLQPVWRTDADLFTLTYESSPKHFQKQVYTPSISPESETVLRWCTKLIDESQDGQKHQQLFKASRLAGGYIEGGVLREEIAIARLEYAISQKPNVSNYKAAQRTIRDGIAQGKLKPIYHQLQTDILIQTHNASQIESLIIEPANDYPSEWDKPDPPGKTPTIRVQSFHDWQCNNPHFSQLGIKSLKNYTPYEKGKESNQ